MSTVRATRGREAVVTANWAGNVEFGERELARPSSVEELQEIVRGNDRVKALGSRHSFSTVADTTGVLVDLSDLPHRLEIDRENRTATVSPGLRYAEVALALDDAGLALKNMGSLPHICVAGAAATGTHGSGDANQVLAASVSALDLVGADGELQHLDRSDPAFEGSVVALGALGIVTSLTIDVVPAFDMRQDVFVDAPWDDVLTHLDGITGGAYSTSMFIRDWGTDRVDQIWYKSVVDGGGDAPRLPDGVGARPSPVDLLPPAEGAPEDMLTEQAGTTGRWLERLPHFRADKQPSNAGDELQSEFLLDRTRAVEALQRTREIAAQLAPVLLVSEIRTIAADTLWLSGAYGRDTVGVHFTWHKDVEGVCAVLPAVEERLADLGARPHWGKVYSDGYPDPLSRYPRGAEFVALADKLDPRRVFRNAYLDRILGA
jgi:xylitol oxidase